MKTTLVCLAAIAQIVLSSVSAEPVQKIPLYYQKRRSGSDFISADATDLKNGMLGGVVQIGNPPQNLTMAFDTSTGFSWVRGTQCGTENCQGRNDFDSRNSTTIISTGQSFVMDYGEGIVHTTIYMDTFRFAGLTVKHMPFGGAYEMEGFDKGFDGYLGLGRNVNLNTSSTVYAKRDVSASGFVPNAFQQGSGLSSAQFGMYTTTTGSGFSESGSTAVSSVAMPNEVTGGGFGVVKRSSSSDEPAGYLVLGGVDKDAIKGDLYHIDVDDEDDNDSGNWAVSVNSAKFEDDLCFNVSKKAKAVLSSSTDVIGLPNAQAKEFQERWYAEYDKPDNTFKIPCCLMEYLTPFKIELGSIKATIPPHYWSHPRKVATCCEMCRTHIGKSESDTDYVIGSAFTNAFYTQFDTEKNRVSLAMKKNHVKDGLKLFQV
ncbi:atp3 gamma subunit of the F1 sector of mitochondrial F1F0 ATP synthase [Mucor velutinosus]|uniref:Atp3 gamma subunit of the F1 sector of mitochondrial F1F0 ATP synthase n=1 Tax=Mucor velutinosus TaxID=708070 RepID=A0AAN7DH43_9FUNG|nr:atp3 gamma subunit of the F1 sector of mitochondrial F1F0 ATP synthase [Mucor velutinosus]